MTQTMHIYERGTTGGPVSLTQTWSGKNFGKPLCRHAVHSSFGVGFHQCTKLGQVEVELPRHGKVWLCNVHSPEAKDKREAKRKAEDDARRAKERASYEARMRPTHMAAAFRAALEEIANGHNDSRTLAQKTLEQWK